MDILIEKYYEFFKEFCKTFNINEKDEHLVDTPKRVVKTMLEFCNGYFDNPEPYISKTFNTTSDKNDYNECNNICSINTVITENGILVIHSGIPFTSLCCHHLLPFSGYVYVGMLFNKKVVGLSKVPRIVNVFSKRMQIQENLTQEITNTLSKIENCEGVIVITDAIHECMSLRGIKSSSITTCSSLTGIFLKESTIKHEFLSLIIRKNLTNNI